MVLKVKTTKKRLRKYKYKRGQGVVRRRKDKVVHGRSSLILYRDPRYTPLPQEYITKLRARGQGYLTPTGSGSIGFGSTYFWAFNNMVLNQIYAPFSAFQTAGINQIDSQNWTSSPFLQTLGFTTLCNQLTYGRYLPINCKVLFRMMPTNTSDRIHACMTPLQTGTGGAPPVNITQSLDTPYSVRGEFNPGEQTRSMTMFIDFAKYLGIDKKIYMNSSDGSYDAAYNADPSIGVGIHFSAAQVGHSPIVANIGFELDLEWEVRFFELRTNLLL